jgi:ribosomal protein S12 methylthiotransferase
VAYPGEIVQLEITDASDYDLVGRVVGRDPSRARQKLPAAKRPPPPKKRGLTVLH